MFKKRYSEVWGIQSLHTSGGGYYPAPQAVNILLQMLADNKSDVELKVMSFDSYHLNLRMVGNKDEVQRLKNDFCIRFGDKYSLNDQEVYIKVGGK